MLRWEGQGVPPAGPAESRSAWPLEAATRSWFVALRISPEDTGLRGEPPTPPSSPRGAIDNSPRRARDIAGAHRSAGMQRRGRGWGSAPFLDPYLLRVVEVTDDNLAAGPRLPGRTRLRVVQGWRA